MHEPPLGLRERKKERTRALIAERALELFAQRGYQRTTVAEIAEAAEVSERTVFGYFASKEDLLFADQHALERELAAALADAPAEGGALEALRGFAIESLSRVDEHARLRRQIVRGDVQLLAHQRARQAAMGEAIAAAIARELGERADDLRPQLVAAAVVAAFSAVYEHRHRARSHTASRAQAVAVIDEAITFLRGGLDAIRTFPKPY